MSGTESKFNNKRFTDAVWVVSVCESKDRKTIIIAVEGIKPSTAGFFNKPYLGVCKITAANKSLLVKDNCGDENAVKKLCAEMSGDKYPAAESWHVLRSNALKMFHVIGEPGQQANLQTMDSRDWVRSMTNIARAAAQRPSLMDVLSNNLCYKDQEVSKYKKQFDSVRAAVTRSTIARMPTARAA